MGFSAYNFGGRARTGENIIDSFPAFVYMDSASGRVINA
jgi:hypothetical protein